MKLVDWQAYHDGSLESEMQAQVEKLLETDPAARAEYDGFRKLQSSLALVRGHEPIPHQNLKGRLDRVLQRKNRWQWPTIVAATILAGVAFSFLTYKSSQAEYEKSVQIESGDFQITLCNPAVESARKFVIRETTLNVGELDLPADVGLSKITCGKDWARFEFSGKWSYLSLGLRAKGEKFKDAPPFEHNGRTYKFLPKGLGWTNSKEVFYLKGDDRKKVLEVADQLSVQTDRWSD